MKKVRFFSLLTLLLTTCTLPIYADVVGQTFTVDGMTYSILSATAPNYTVKCTGISTKGDVTVPATVIHGDITYSVKQVYAQPGSATSMTLSEGIEKLSWRIGGGAIRTLNLPATFNGFANDGNANYNAYAWTYCGGNLQKIVVAEDNKAYKSIDGILYNKAGTQLILIPMKANYVDGDGRFLVPDGVTQMNWYHEGGIGTGNGNNRDSRMKILSIPSSCKTINGIGTINGWCHNLKAYEVRSGNTTYSASEDVLYNYAGTTLIAYPRAKEGTEFTIPDKVTAVSGYAFTGNAKLTTITAGAGVKTINAYAFANLTNLTTLDLSQTQITTLPANVVYNCPKLTNILLPASVDIGSVLESGAINYCPNVVFSVSDEDPNYSVDEYGILFNKDKTKLIKCPGSFTGDDNGNYEIPATVVEIGNKAFQKSLLTGISFAEGCALTKIGANAFTSAKIKSFCLPATVASMGSECFYSCTSLVSFTFTDMSESAPLKALPASCFKSCSALTTLSVPASLTAIGGACFQHCGITAFVVPDKVTSIDHVFYQATKLRSLHVGKKVRQMWGDDYWQAPISTLTFSEDAEITRIGGAMYLTSLTTLAIPASVTTIGAINSSTLTKIIIPEGSKLTSIAPNLAGTLTTIEGLENATKMTTIPANAFLNYKKLKELHFPGSITNIGSRAFEGCINLTDLTFGTSTDPAQITVIGAAALANCGITTFDVPESVTKIGKEAFDGCTGLTEVNIGAAATDIDPEAFKGCVNLHDFHVSEDNNVYADVIGFLTDKTKTTLLAYPQGKSTGTRFTLMPASLTSIGRYAFYNNDQVQKVIVPANVTSIGDFAFLHDTGLRSLIFMGNSLIDPDNIKRGVNDMAFDYPGISKAITDNIMDDITICLTQKAYAQWLAAKKEGEGNKYYDFYSKFKAVETTFTANHSGSNEQDEFMPVGENEASLLATESSLTSYVVPTAVNHNGKDYAVTMISDFAFESASNLKEVVISGTPQYIGSLAFATDITRDANGKVTSTRSTIEDIVFVSSTPTLQLSSVEFDLTNHYNEFLTDIDGLGTAQKIFVKRSAKEAYKAAWPKYASLIETDLPLKNIANQYATFSREFDIDINPKTSAEPKGENWNTALNCPKVIAYTSGYYHKLTDEDVFVHMESINVNDGTMEDVNGTYIPANTGVLLQSTTGELGGGEGLIYTIGEKDLNRYDGENLMQAVVGKGKTAPAKEAPTTNFYMAQGKLWKVPEQGISMPVRTSYLSVEVPANARVFLSFEDDKNTTGIHSVGNRTAEADEEIVYSLSGQRVGKDYKGIVVKGGKKMLRK